MSKENSVIGQDELIKDLGKILEIFKTSDCELRPHFILTGPSGSGKSFTISNLAEAYELGFMEINAAQLTKEGTSGNSLSKALAPLASTGGKPTIVFVDEFDKLFISGNSNDSQAHESTTGVQNEFLKVLESDKTSVFGDYGKYVNIPIKNCLFVFAGAFNGEEDLDLDRLRDIGLKTEFLGRVGLVFNTQPLTIESLFSIIDKSVLLKTYLTLFEGVDKEEVLFHLKGYVQENFEMNTLGARMINTLIHQYFIKDGNIHKNNVKEITFQKKLSFVKKE